MTMVSRRRELSSFAHKPDTQVDFTIRAERFLEKIKETPTHRLDAKPMRKTVRAAVKDMDRLQHEHREMYAVHLMAHFGGSAAGIHLCSVTLAQELCG